LPFVADKGKPDPEGVIKGMGMTDEGNQAADAGADPIPPAPTVVAAPAQTVQKPAKARKGHRTGLMGRLIILAMAVAFAVGLVSLPGKSIPLPVWAVAEIEARLNKALSQSLTEGAVAIGSVEITVGGDWFPRLRLEDLRLLKAGGESLLTLPEVHLSLDGKSILSGGARVQTLRIIGARLEVKRDRTGRFDIALGSGQFAPEINSFAQIFDLMDQVLAAPGFASLRRIEAEALTIGLHDMRSGRTYQIGDGRLQLENGSEALAGEFSLSMVGPTGAPGRALLTVVSPKGASSARISATIDGIAAQDLAQQSVLLAPLGILDAAISGRIAATLAVDGISELEGRLQIGSGALRPTKAAEPVLFDRAALGLFYDAPAGRVVLSDLEVDSPSLRIKAAGQALLVRADGSRISGALSGELPDAFLTQFSFSQVKIDPAGLFEEPVQFSAGALDLRMKLDPFLVEIGQLSLAEEARRLTATGRIGADTAGWNAAIDLKLNEIANDRLMALWPRTLLAKTRDWVGRNLLKATVFDVEAALRIAPGQEPRLHLGYSFEDADARFLATLPPIQNGYGYSTIDGVTYTMVLSRGRVTPPEGGEIDVAGSVFAVPDVSQKPARAEILLRTSSSLTAALSLLDQPPFNFMSKADRPVALGEGVARIETRLSLPLQKKIALSDVHYDVSGTIVDFSSDKLVPGRSIRAEKLMVSADPAGLAITGAGRLGEVAFDVTYAQGFTPETRGKSRIEGTVLLSQQVAEEFGLGLPPGMVSGKGEARVIIDLAKGQPGKLVLSSDLRQIGLTIPEVGWSKPAASRGLLEAQVTLGATPKVDSLKIDAAGLFAEGSIRMRAGGGLDLARFDRVRLQDWLDGTLEIAGRGKGKPVGLAMTGGTVDIRKMPSQGKRRSAGAKGTGTLTVALDRLVVSSGIALTGFSGSFSLNGGLNGDFTARINDGPPITGAIVPTRSGSAVRMKSDDAGATMAAAGIFGGARGGKLDLTLTPRPQQGHYDGQLQIKSVRVRNTSILTELLNAISVVGLLEQLNGSGILFSDVDGAFLLTPGGVQITRGSAVGASLGVSMAGVYQTANGKLAMQGVVSPIYLLNGIGAMLTKRGEGVFGFNFDLRGTAANPKVDVNPLSILTPGMFREIFRGAAPILGEGPAPKIGKE
jgi:hypothetical protein